MKNWFWPLASLLVSLAVGVPPAHAAREFSNIDILGPWAATFSGTLGGTPVVAVGQFVSDGHGTFADGARTVDLGGTVGQQTFTCTYTVNPNGSGVASCTVSGEASPETYAFALIDEARAAYFIGTTPGTVVSGTAHKQ
jgi:hypothetical protein